MSRADFLPAPSNAAALASVDGWRDWPSGKMMLVGPRGSGRTHLTHLWAKDAGAVIFSGRALDTNWHDTVEHAGAIAIDDADVVAGNKLLEEQLFHLFNHAQFEEKPLLLTAKDVAGTWGARLPDLESRMQTLPITRIEQPDDGLLNMVLVKLCDDRQLAIGPETISYLVNRMERSLAVARELVAELDHTALIRQRRITRPLAAEILANFHPHR
ncbi:HdaA/DnaA family protein [Qingshengfaniella alkalisoli]|nr:DnaA/Hda family protein [Qingshengfaniella alkalisoli]